MMLLSIDVGIRNLAMVLMETETKKIIEWVCDGVPPESESGLFESLKSHLDGKAWLSQASLVIIEKQPDRNKRIKSVEYFLHTYFLCHSKEVRIWDAKHKIPDVVGPGKRQYAKRKKAAVDRCRLFLEGTDTNKHLIPYFDKHKKKDDLADCVMQALSFLPQTLPEKQKPTRTKTARAPTENQTATKYSKANLAWLYKNGQSGTARFQKDLKRYYTGLDQLIAEFKI
jgi:hypothetical protein